MNEKELYEFITSELRSYCNRNGILFYSFMATKLTDLLQELESEEEYEAYEEMAITKLRQVADEALGRQPHLRPGVARGAHAGATQSLMPATQGRYAATDAALAPRVDHAQHDERGGKFCLPCCAHPDSLTARHTVSRAGRQNVGCDCRQPRGSFGRGS